MQGRFLALRHDQSAKQRGDVRVTQRAAAQWLRITDGGPTVSATDYRSCHSATKDARTLPPHAQERAAPPPQQKASSSIPLAAPRRDRIPLKSTEAVRIPSNPPRNKCKERHRLPATDGSTVASSPRATDGTQSPDGNNRQPIPAFGSSHNGGKNVLFSTIY